MLKFSITLLVLFSLAQGLPHSTVQNLLKTWKLNEIDVTFKELPSPQELVLQLSEDEFEDYLDFWLSKKYESESEDFGLERAPCTVGVSSLTEPQPVYELGSNLKLPSGATGNLVFADSEAIVASCMGSNNRLVHSSSTQNPVQASVSCSSGTTFASSSWLSTTTTLGNIKCNSHIPWVETRTSTSCAAGQGVKINVAIQSSARTHIILTSCFKESTSEALFVEYDQNTNNKVNQPNVARPNFLQGQWYPGLSVDNLYTQVSQKAAIASVVGSALADVYVTSTNFLARGHLAAKTDFVLSPPQRATFTFINVAPQWQPFNGGNWNTLEQNLRDRIGDTNKNTRVYTGTWGILKLKDSSGTGRDIYLSPSNKKIPVPLWYYKVVHEPSTNRATAYLGLNNPHVTLAEAKSLAFCTDVCNGNNNFSWLNWKAENVAQGYSLCCDVTDFKRTVNHLPSFTVSGLLY